MVRIGYRGFSIVEIIVGLQIVTVLVLMTVPNFIQTLRIYTLRAAARELYSDLTLARMGAVMEDHQYRVILVNSTTYQLHDDTNNNNAIDAGEPVTTRATTTDAPGVTLSGTSALTFLPDGTVQSSGSYTVTKDTRTATVTVSSGGRVKVSFPTS